jgi:hypothetical protein
VASGDPFAPIGAAPTQDPIVVGPGMGPAVPPDGPGKLYTPAQVGIAAFFGLPVAGGLALASTLRRLGRRAEATKVLVLATAATGLLVLLAVVTPSNLHVSYGDLLGTYWLHRWAKRSIGPAVEAHKAAGGKLRSGWSAFGLGLASIAAFMLAGGALAVAGPVAVREKLTDCAIQGPNEVCFEDGAELADARGVLTALLDSGLQPGEKVDVKVRRPAGGVAIAFVVQEGAWADAKVVAAFTGIGKDLRKVFPAGKLDVLLADDSWSTKKGIAIP